MLIHDLVQTHASKTADAVAVVEGKRRITYAQLDKASTNLAHVLRGRGVRVEAPVAVCMRRSIDFVVGTLGILKAGAAYVPLDPGYPSKRLTTLLKDSGANLVLTQACTKSRGGDWEPVVVDSYELTRGEQVEPLVVADVSPENLAYVIFTSGSTGHPKGVQVTHSSLLNLIRWHQNAFSVSSRDRATFQASPGFDAAVWEIWPHLASGATVYVVDDEVRTSPELLRNWFLENGITISFLPTAMAEQVMELPWPNDAPLRFLLTGADTLRRYPRTDMPFALVNNYGPTECTVVATSGVVPKGSSRDQLPSIGKAIDNTQVYIVDENMGLAPDGTAGEILIGGAGVARGYLNRPDLTSEKFIPNPFNPTGKDRLYRTGDLARRLPSGEIAFLGRIDEQVKIRGYRIEPQEIVAALDRHAGVHASFVCTQKDDCGEKRLVAYVVLKSKASQRELRDYLSEQLPDYMIPSVFVSITELPLSANGKIDRNALPLPCCDNVVADQVFEAPQSPIEERIAGFLTTLLGVARIGREDNFFTLGGHSLLGAQMIAKIRDAFGVELSLRNLFDNPTVAGISAEVEKLIYDKLASMSDEEAQRLLSSAQAGL